MTGRLLPRKGFQYVLQAADGIEADFEIHLAGDGPMRAELEALADRIDKRVVFHGWLDHGSAQLRQLYESSAVFCLPSEVENASISLLEAMLAGMAVVTSDATGCPETIGEAGLVVPPRDVTALRDTLTALWGDEDRRETLSREARARVLEHFDQEQLGDAILERLATASNPAEV